MRQVGVDSGSWHFKIVNSNGIGLRKHPIDDWNYRFNEIYEQSEVVTCDRRIQNMSGASFYRVKGTDGWIFDRQNDYQMMFLVKRLMVLIMR